MNKRKETNFIRILAFTLALFAVSAFAGCGGKVNDDLLDSVDDIAQFALSNGSFPEMIMEDDSVLTEVYGIDLSNVAEYKVMAASDNLLADAIAVFRVSDRSYIDLLVRALNSRLSADARVASQYSPEQFDKINNCEVRSCGDYVFYIVNDDGQAISARLLSRISPEMHY